MYEAPFRDASHTDAQSEAYAAGHSAGWDHANFVEAYGATEDSEPQGQYEAHADIWREGYAEGVSAFEALQDDEATYGHDWRGESGDESTAVLVAETVTDEDITEAVNSALLEGVGETVGNLGDGDPVWAGVVEISGTLYGREQNDYGQSVTYRFVSADAAAQWLAAMDAQNAR